MSIAWTTVLIILFLCPGIVFQAGLYSKDRIPREIVRAGVIGEIALAVLVSIVIHLLGWLVVSGCGFAADHFFTPLVEFDSLPHEWWVPLIEKRILPLGIYIVISATIGYFLGFGLSRTKWFVTHKWALELTSADTLVTAYIMTKTTINDHILMYRGGLSEFYLKLDGSFSYLVLNDCQKFHMSATDGTFKMADPKPLFGVNSDNSWDFLSIDSANIANILFEKSPKLDVTESGNEALRQALDELAAALRK